MVEGSEAAEGFMSRLPDARMVWFDQCGHAPMIEKPADFAKAVLLGQAFDEALVTDGLRTLLM